MADAIGSDAIGTMLRLGIDHRARLRALTSPYDLLVEIARFQRVCGERPLRTRYAMQLYPDFIRLVALFPRADQDACVHVGKRIFRVNVPTMRADLQAARADLTLRPLLS